MNRSSSLNRMAEIYQEEGVRSLIRSIYDYIRFDTTIGDPVRLWIAKRRVKERIQKEDSLGDILDTVLNIQPGLSPYRVRALQIREELQTLADRVNTLQPTTILEVGTANGGTLYTWLRLLNGVETAVSVDLPRGDFGGGYFEGHSDLFELFDPDVDLTCVRGNSHNEWTLHSVQKAFDGEPVDFLFIDGDHTYEGVKQDFKMYSPLVRDGGIIAFHDIADHPDNPNEIAERRKNATKPFKQHHLRWEENFAKCEVSKFWSEIESKYNTERILSHPYQTWGGIGIVQK